MPDEHQAAPEVDEVINEPLVAQRLNALDESVAGRSLDEVVDLVQEVLQAPERTPPIAVRRGLLHEAAQEIFVGVPMARREPTFQRLLAEFPEAAAELQSARSRVSRIHGWPPVLPVSEYRLRATAIQLAAGYELPASLSGGCADLFVAEETALQREVILKLAKPDLQSDNELNSLILQEVQTLARISHPRFRGVYGVKTDALDRPVQVLEFVRGPSLREYLSRRSQEREAPLKPIAIVRCLIGIAEGLQAMHRAGYYHRDLKPDNVLLREAELTNPVLIDAGLAMQRAERVRESQIVAGTMEYLSPEQWKQEILDGRSDVWSLAVMGVEMTIGEPCWGTSRADIEAAVVGQTWVPNCREGRPEIPEGLQEFFTRCLQRNPDQRFSTIDDALAALRQVAEHVAHSAYLETTRPFFPEYVIAPDLYVGRDQVMEELATTLRSRRMAVLIGEQGTGKTLAASLHCQESRHGYTPARRVWVDGTSRDSLEQDLELHAEALRIRHAKDRSQTALNVYRALAQMPDSILVVDNLESESLLQSFESGIRRVGALLATSRLPLPDGLFQKRCPPVAIRAFEPGLGAEFLLRRTGRAAFATEAERQQARAISEAMEGLPLALEQAAAYISACPCTLEHYSAAFANDSDAASRLNMHGTEEGGTVWPTGHLVLARTVTMNLDLLQSQRPDAATLVRALSYLAPQPIPTRTDPTFRSAVAGLIAHIRDASQYDSALRLAVRMSLLRIANERGDHDIHRLTALIVRTSTPPDSNGNDYAVACALMCQLLRLSSFRELWRHSAADHATNHQHSPHVIALIARKELVQHAPSAVARLIHWMSIMLEEHGDATLSFESSHQCVDLMRAAFGSASEWYASALQHHSKVTACRLELPSALKYNDKALAIVSQRFGDMSEEYGLSLLHRAHFLRFCSDNNSDPSPQYHPARREAIAGHDEYLARAARHLASAEQILAAAYGDEDLTVMDCRLETLRIQFRAARRMLPDQKALGEVLRNLELLLAQARTASKHPVVEIDVLGCLMEGYILTRRWRLALDVARQAVASASTFFNESASRYSALWYVKSLLHVVVGVVGQLADAESRSGRRKLCEEARECFDRAKVIAALWCGDDPSIQLKTVHNGVMLSAANADWVTGVRLLHDFIDEHAVWCRMSQQLYGMDFGNGIVAPFFKQWRSQEPRDQRCEREQRKVQSKLRRR